MLAADDILVAIKSFPAGSVAGLDGLYDQYLNSMTYHQPGVGEQLVTTLTDFVNVCLLHHIRWAKAVSLRLLHITLVHFLTFVPVRLSERDWIVRHLEWLGAPVCSPHVCLCVVLVPL